MACESAGRARSRQRPELAADGRGLSRSTYGGAMTASSRSLDDLFTVLTPDPERPAELPAGVAEMRVADFTEGPLASGVWTCGVGAWDEEDAAAEVMVILEGHVRVTGRDGTVTEARGGEMLQIPDGWSGRWEVLEAVRKVWVMTGEV